MILIINFFLLILLVLLLLTTSVFAKYSSKEKLTGTMKIAKPIFLVNGSEKCDISAINNIGYYEFTVRNYDDNDISETGFKYTIEVVSETDDSIKFELYNEDELIPLNNLISKELFIDGNQKIEQKYKLKVTYDSNLGTKGKDILEEVQVKVHSEQQDIGL